MEAFPKASPRLPWTMDAMELQLLLQGGEKARLWDRMTSQSRIRSRQRLWFCRLHRHFEKGFSRRNLDHRRWGVSAGHTWFGCSRKGETRCSRGSGQADWRTSSGNRGPGLAQRRTSHVMARFERESCSVGFLGNLVRSLHQVA